MGPVMQSHVGLTVEPATVVDLPPARPLAQPHEVLEARRLHARAYVAIGYLTQADLAADGTVDAEADPWAPYSRYVGAFDADGRIRATARLIQDQAPWPLPALQLPGIDPSARDHLGTLPAGRVGEISALARDAQAGMAFTRAAFRAMWLMSTACGITDWILAVDQLVLRTLKRMDQDLFTVIGTPSPAAVRPVLPVRARPGDVRESIFTNGLARRVVTLP